MSRVVPPGELAARIESALLDAPHADDPEKAVDDLKEFLLDHAQSIVNYLRAVAQ
jgi:hypothetical protein